MECAQLVVSAPRVSNRGICPEAGQLVSARPARDAATSTLGTELMLSERIYWKQQAKNALLITTGFCLNILGHFLKNFPSIAERMTVQGMNVLNVHSPFLDKLADRHLYEFCYKIWGPSAFYGGLLIFGAATTVFTARWISQMAERRKLNQQTPLR
ncbi:MAG: hypothetical protein ABIE03_03615 [Patescibacteria group bacterium]|nr:hypothetical protein [Patescibacteria group bacterium]